MCEQLNSEDIWLQHNASLMLYRRIIELIKEELGYVDKWAIRYYEECYIGEYDNVAEMTLQCDIEPDNIRYITDIKNCRIYAFKEL